MCSVCLPRHPAVAYLFLVGVIRHKHKQQQMEIEHETEHQIIRTDLRHRLGIGAVLSYVVVHCI